MRLSCCLATEQGVAVCAPIHDAMLVEGDIGEIGDVVTTTRAAMCEASRDVLGDLEIGTDVSVVAYPYRYADPRGQVMWERIIERLQGVQVQLGAEGV